MQENELVLSEYEEINSLLYKPIIATQRIKYTCFNVSTNHIVLGSTSGSLYLFTREPCTFQQVIPLSEGPVTHVQISPDEKTVALSTKRGSVCILSLKPTAKLLSISNEHLQETVTSLCWNSKSCEIYVGDNNGKISTIVLSIFTVNGMFQAPSCALMHLDSSIVQLDYNLHYLLVSTLTRCYICDTSQEQFKQIGNKARDGAFGACFMKKPPVEIQQNAAYVESEKSQNKSVALNSIISSSVDNPEDNILIYSARPGLRLWEVTTNGVVIKTHQFKEALSVPPSEIHKSTVVKCLYPTINNEQNSPQIFNFSHLFVISKKYLLSHTNNSLYIIDPTNAAVVLWTDKLNNISMAKIIEDKIYLMDSNGPFHCLMLSSVDKLIIKLFDLKLYNDCYTTCMTFRSDLINLIESNNSSSLDDFNDCSNNVISILESIISIIRWNFNTQPKRLNCGIVVVNSGNSIMRKNGKYDRDYDSSSDSEIVIKSVIKPSRKLDVKKTNVKDMEEAVNEIDEQLTHLTLPKTGEDSAVINGDELQNARRKEVELATMNIQSDLQPLYTLISTLKSSMGTEDLENTIFQIIKTLQDINFKYEDVVELNIFLYEIVRSTEKLYFHALLENICPDILMNHEESHNEYIVQEVFRAFVDLNSCDYSECTCGFPKLRMAQPNFLDVGQNLMKIFSEDNRENCLKLCKMVPCLWVDYLRICIDKGEGVDSLLRLCLQTRHNTVLSIILPLVSDNTWNVIAECVEMMTSSKCILCGKNDEANGDVKGSRIDWSGIAQEILKKEGMAAAMTFLGKVGNRLPRVQLKESIFQSLICTKLLSQRGFDQVVELDRNGEGCEEYSSICSKEAREELVEALAKDLDRPVNSNIFGSGAHHWGMKYKTKSSMCPCCTLSLQTPVLLGNNGISIFPCGHAYHVNCLIQKKLTRCYLHSLE